jgi:hypothetical protein
VGSAGPAGGSVAVGVGDAGTVAEGPNVGNAACVAVAVGVRVATRVQVGSGVGVAGAGPGKATMMRLMIMLPAMIRLRTQSIFWLVVCFRLLRLLTRLNLQTKCVPHYTIAAIVCKERHWADLNRKLGAQPVPETEQMCYNGR